MMEDSVFKNSLKLAEQFTKEVQDVPKVFDKMLSEILPTATPEEKTKLQNIVKDSNKIIEEARKTGDFAKIKQSIDELSSKYGRNNNT